MAIAAILLIHCCVFFFSSRRRHTRCGRDWSSDVCSSDLWPLPLAEEVFPLTAEERAEEDRDRWQHMHYGTGQTIIRLFDPAADDRKDTLTTSLQRLARQLDLDPESVREGILILLDEGDFSINVDIAHAPQHKVFTLRVDWERFAHTRIGISCG